MRNFYFIGLLVLLVWALDFLSPWYFFKPWILLFTLGYVCFVLEGAESALLLSVAFVWLSSFSGLGVWSILLLLSSLWILGQFPHKTFEDNFVYRALLVFGILFAFWLWTVKNTELATWRILLQAFIQIGVGIFTFWFLEEKGAIWEEKTLRPFVKQGRLSFVEAKKIKRRERL